jgi:UDP-N-acetylglucosamine--N-acetylmuramyl-(pentapeptide) pyrophosphoryl-undecaprenol N-acetylglucosamine transferase
MKGRVIIACGGTGGHLFPGVAVGTELLRRGHAVRLIVSEKEIDRVALQGTEGFEVTALPAIGWPGLGLKTLPFVVKFFRARQACRRLVSSWKPTLVLGMGGFTCAAPLLAARSLGLPAWLHESNAIPGKVTRYLASRVSGVLLGLEACAKHLPGVAVRVTGTPVRSGLVNVPRDAGITRLNLDAARRTLLVMGGSQGARGLNDAVLRGLPVLAPLADSWQVVHLSGAADAERVAAAYAAAGFPARVMPFCTDMGAVYAVADLVVARSGASSLTEIALAELPSVLVPLPTAAENHQWRNADVFVNAGAAVAFDQTTGKGPELGRQLLDLIVDPTRLATMRQAARSLAQPDAAVLVADAVEAGS